MSIFFTIFKVPMIKTLIISFSVLLSNLVMGQDWFDTDWQYRREVVVDNPASAELTEYQVLVELDGSFDFTKANNDGSDVRITGSDGTTLIYYWIERWDAIGSQATIWVKTPSISVSGTILYIYYGNNLATAFSDGENTFDFFDDFETQIIQKPGYYTFGPASTIMVEDQSWETSAPHSLSVVEAPTGAPFTYYGYYGLQTDGGIGMAGSNDLINWTKFPETGPLPNNPLFNSDGERWASVLLDGGIYYMVHTRNYSGTSNIVYRESTDGLNWTGPTQVIPPVSGDRNQNPNIFYDPNDNQYYMYWFRRSGGLRRIMVRTASTVADLTTAPDVELISSIATVASPNMLYYDNTYFLSTEINEGGIWKIRIYEGNTPTGPFNILPGNPVLDDGCACLFQTHYSQMIYEYYCKLTAGTWTLDMRVVDPSTGRIMYEYGEIDETKWTPDGGGTWDAISVNQQDGTEGIVAEGSISADKSILMSSFSGNDYILEGYGRQIADRVWGFGVRTTDAQNTYALNIYEDLDNDPLNNLHFYRFHTQHGNNDVWSNGLGIVDHDIWYKLMVKAYGNNFEIYVNDILKNTTPLYDNSLDSGSIALYGEDGTIAQYNDVRVRKYTVSEPLSNVGEEQTQATLVDIAIYNTSCGIFEIRLKPDFDIIDNSLSNVQFTIKWPANSINLINFDSDFGIAQQGPDYMENDTNFAVFVSTSIIPVNWTAESEYTILSFAHDQAGSGYIDLLIDTGDWSSINNGTYYVELLGSDNTGVVYQQANNVYLGYCGRLNVKVFLEGPYNSTLGLMNTILNAAGDLPLEQPYYTEPWNYTGDESVIEMPADAIDWILVELRSAPDADSATPATRISRQAGLLKYDGCIYNSDNSSELEFNTSELDKLFIVLWHRNHLGVISTNGVIPSSTDYYELDFSTSASQALGNGQNHLDGGVYGMIGGDANADGIINISDAIQVWIPQAGTEGYFSGDLNLDRQVNNLDKNEIWYENIYIETQVPD